MTDQDVESGLGGEAAAPPGSNRSRSESKSGQQNRPDFVRNLSKSGNSLYEILDLPKESTDQEIKKKYRRLALKYHPDKNPNNPEAEEMFKKINNANSILSDEKKRSIYDKYGSFGIYLTEQMGGESEGLLKMMNMMSSVWCNLLSLFCFCATGCCCCCCLCCCCACCCGKCAPKVDESDHPDWGDLQDDDDEDQNDVIVTEPGVDNIPLNGTSESGKAGYGTTNQENTAADEKERTKPEDTVTEESEK